MNMLDQVLAVAQTNLRAPTYDSVTCWSIQGLADIIGAASGIPVPTIQVGVRSTFGGLPVHEDPNLPEGMVRFDGPNLPPRVFSFGAPPVTRAIWPLHPSYPTETALKMEQQLTNVTGRPRAVIEPDGTAHLLNPDLTNPHTREA